jgi:hypothetical protein
VASAAEAVERIDARYRDDAENPPTALIEASLALMRAWVLRAQESPSAVEAARRSAEWARQEGAPWWLARAIRALPDGEATASELAEADAIEQRLRVADGASAPPI